MNKGNEAGTKDREISLTRTFDAPRERVFEAMTDPLQVVRWWGPNGFSTTNHEMDVRPGGVWRRTLHGPDGKNYINKSIYDEVVRPEKISFTHAGGEEGNKDRSACFKGVWIFEEAGKNKTHLTMKIVFETKDARDECAEKFGAVEGGKQTLARLATHLGEKSEPYPKPFLITRTFDAPRELVWKCWTEEKRMQKWWGPKECKVGVSKMDLRPGGSHHYSLIAGGHEIWGKSIYREITKPERIVFINSFSDSGGGLTRHPGSETWPLQMLTIVTFVEKNGKTAVTIQWEPLNPSAEERKTFDDGHGSMTQGWTGSLDRLEAYLKTGGKE